MGQMRYVNLDVIVEEFLVMRKPIIQSLVAWGPKRISSSNMQSRTGLTTDVISLFSCRSSHILSAVKAGLNRPLFRE
jgi:hypothetical protein